MFYRFNKTKDYHVIGIPILPSFISPEDNTFNRALLLRLINEGNVFDIDLRPQNKDRLQLSFYVDKPIKIWESKEIHYGFQYRNGKWLPKDFDSFEWEWKHDEEKSGKIDKAGTHRKGL